MRDIKQDTENSDQVRIDEQQIDFYHNTMKKFQNYCVVCFPIVNEWGVTVHEIIPKSKRPKDWWLIPDNGCPLCAVHHNEVHQKSTKEGEEYCRIHMEKCLRGLGVK